MLMISGKEGGRGRKADMVPPGPGGEVHPEAFQENTSDIMSDGWYSGGMEAACGRAMERRLLTLYMRD